MPYDPFAWLSTPSMGFEGLPFYALMTGQSSKPSPASQFPSFYNPALFDDEGRYGITDALRSDARMRGFGDLGAALIAGANSGSWGGMAKGLSMGMTQSAATNDAYLDKLSQAKLKEVLTNETMRKAEQDYRMGNLDMQTKEQMLQDNQLKMDRRESSIKEMQANFETQQKAMELAISMEPDAARKKLMRNALDQVEVAVKAGDFAGINAGMQDFAQNASDTSNALLDQIAKAEAAKTYGREAGELRADAEQAAQFAGQTRPDGSQFVQRNGKWGWMSKEELEKESLQLQISREQLDNARDPRGKAGFSALSNAFTRVSNQFESVGSVEAQITGTQAEIASLQQLINSKDTIMTDKAAYRIEIGKKQAELAKLEADKISKQTAAERDLAAFNALVKASGVDPSVFGLQPSVAPGTLTQFPVIQDVEKKFAELSGTRSNNTPANNATMAVKQLELSIDAQVRKGTMTSSEGAEEKARLREWLKSKGY